MAIHVRPLDAGDDAQLATIDAGYARRHRLEPVLTRGSVSFFARSGHAFVALDEDGPRGFALAQAVWDGTRPTLRLQRLALGREADRGAGEALVEAVTKSAYDAAVYDLVAEVPDDDAEADGLLRGRAWSPLPRRLYERRLGSRGGS